MIKWLTALGRAFKPQAREVTVEELERQLVDLQAQAQAIQDTADSEDRELTDAEQTTLDGVFSKFEETEVQIARRKRLAALGAKVTDPGRRTTRPADALATEGEGGTRRPITGGESAAAKAMPGTGGFRSMGDFLKTVHRADVHKQVDGRLGGIRAAAPTTYGNESAGADGGYLVPPDFRTTLLAKVLGQDSLLGMTDQQTTSSNSITFPVDETTPWQTSGGVQAFWEGEATALNQSKPALGNTTIRANKISAICPVTDEQLEDGPALEAYIRRKVPDKINFKVSDAIVNGDGVGKPSGILKSNALITQAAEGGQTAGTVVFNNIVKMYARMYAPLRRNAVWLVNQDLEPQLASMVVPGGSPAMPAYLPPGGLTAAPNGTLMGRPIIYSEVTQAAGTVGDIVLVDFNQYLTLVKGGGIRTDVSMHLWFDQSLTAFRFVLRVGGQCWWAAPITRTGGKNTLSCAVALAAR